METGSLESAMEAQQEHTQTAGPGSGDPTTVLTFLEKKMGYLRGIFSSASRQVVSAELSCIAAQLLSISQSLAATASDEDGAVNVKSPPPCADSESSDDHDVVPPPAWSAYEVIQLEEREILAPHVHTCKVCGKGFKRDANLRMHMRGHGEEYKTAAALAKPPAVVRRDVAPQSTPDATAARCLYSCPYVGCKRNREHKSFQPLKTAVCVKNHYRRSHCDKRYVCRRCNVKRFSVLADLRTHEKHCGRDRWICSCGTSFSRKDKLFGHVAAFDGHAPALPPDDEDLTNQCTAANDIGSDQIDAEAISRMASMDCFSDTSIFDEFNCSDMEGFPLPLADGPCLDDGRGFLSPIGIDSCSFEGFGLFGPPGLELEF